jgi:hypothetical protein
LINHNVFLQGQNNQSPISQALPIVEVMKGGSVQWLIGAADYDGDSLTYSMPNGGPPGLSVSSSGLVTWDTDDGVRL